MADEAVPAVPGADALARQNPRASHEDRDRIVEELRVAGGDGRLDADELDTRVEAALTARPYRDLAALVAHPPGRPLGRAGADGGEGPQRRRQARLHRGSGHLADPADRGSGTQRQPDPD